MMLSALHSPHLSLSHYTLYNFFFFFFFNDPATTEIYTLSLHDALPISKRRQKGCAIVNFLPRNEDLHDLILGEFDRFEGFERSEEHTSELQSPDHLVCRLLLEKKKKKTKKKV